MQRGLLSSRLGENDYSFMRDQADFKCGECGGAFKKPILATFSSHGMVQEYNACPRCLAKIQSKERSKEALVLEKEVKKTFEKSEDETRCMRFPGYLKKRPKDAPIPEECLTCEKMIKCLLH